MAIVVGDREKKQSFINYALGINRVDSETGERLGAQHFKLRRPFKLLVGEPTVGLGRVIQGAADGSEAILAG